MGWMYGPTMTPKTIADKFVKGWDGMKCIAHTTVPEDGRLVLWAVMEYTVDTEHYKKGFRWILCVLMDNELGHWGYKDMCESISPCYYSCPIEYFDLAPPDGEFSIKWREEVKAYNGRKAA